MTTHDADFNPPGTPVILLVDPEIEFIKNVKSPMEKNCPFKKGGLYFLREKCHIDNSVIVLVEAEGIGDNINSTYPFYVDFRRNVYFA